MDQEKAEMGERNKEKEREKDGNKADGVTGKKEVDTSEVCMLSVNKHFSCLGFRKFYLIIQLCVVL